MKKERKSDGISDLYPNANRVEEQPVFYGRPSQQSSSLVDDDDNRDARDVFGPLTATDVSARSLTNSATGSANVPAPLMLGRPAQKSLDDDDEGSGSHNNDSFSNRKAAPMIFGRPSARASLDDDESTMSASFRLFPDQQQQVNPKFHKPPPLEEGESDCKLPPITARGTSSGEDDQPTFRRRTEENGSAVANGLASLTAVSAAAEAPVPATAAVSMSLVSLEAGPKTSSSSSATLNPENMSESDMLEAAIQASQQQLQTQQSEARASLEAKIETFKDNARTLRDIASSTSDAELLQFSMAECRQDLATIETLLGQSDQTELLLDVNDIVLHALETAKHAKTTKNTVPATLDDWEEVLDEDDVFSMIYRLRHEPELSVAQKLLALSSTRGPEIISLGGLPSLLSVMNASNDALKMVAALAIARVVPSLQTNNWALPILEALQYLVGCNYDQIVIGATKQECQQAASVALTSLWIHQPSSTTSEPEEDGVVSKKLDEDTRILDVTVDLILQLQKEGCREDLILVVEQVSAVARPVSLLPVLVDWLAYTVTLQPAAAALVSLATTPNAYQRGWIHSQMGPALKVITSLCSQTTQTDVRLSFTRILASVVKMHPVPIHFFMDVLYNHEDEPQAALFAAQALQDMVHQGNNTHHKEIIIQRGAVASLVALVGNEKLSRVALETLHVLVVADNSLKRQMWTDEAAMAIGKCLSDKNVALRPALASLHQLLIPINRDEDDKQDNDDNRADDELVGKACRQTVQSGGLESLLDIAIAANSTDENAGKACQCLSVLVPLLFQQPKFLPWTSRILSTVGSLDHQATLIALSSSRALQIRLLSQYFQQPWLQSAIGFHGSLLKEWFGVTRLLELQAMALDEISSWRQKLWYREENATRELHPLAKAYHEMYKDVLPPCSKEMLYQIYPLTSSHEEAQWILEHCEENSSKSALSTHVLRLMKQALPSPLWCGHVASRGSPDATWELSTAIMPQRRYFTLDACLIPSNANCLGFTRSSFTGDFTESLVRALYLAPGIRGLFFTECEDYSFVADLLATLPAWITFWSLSNSDSIPTLLPQFQYWGLTHSCEIDATTWSNFLSGASLSNLVSLDLSSNELGDHLCGLVLQEHSDSPVLERLDLSGNFIGEGLEVVQALRGIKNANWHTLRLAQNNLNVGMAWLEIISLLKNDQLTLQCLDLSHNEIVADSSQCRVVASCLCENTSLSHIDLSHNSVQNVDVLLTQLGQVPSLGLASLDFTSNTPALSRSQTAALESLCHQGRQVRLERQRQQDNSVANGEQQQEDITSAVSALPSTEASEFENQITVLFSAPLVFRDQNGDIQPFDKLDFHLERELLWQCLKEASRDICLSFDCAQSDRLLAAITKKCSCLHYSGHGHPEYLAFENESGGPHWFYSQQIKDLIVDRPFQFVFVSACYSELAGETFCAAGVPHVVCCQQTSELKDAAALAFTRHFYLALAVGRTVKYSFDQACKAVRATPNLRDSHQEMLKFVLLPKDGNHDVPVFDAPPVLSWPPSKNNGSWLQVRNVLQKDPSPSPPQFFMGREVDMHHILAILLKKRLVSVVGEPGMGRSSLVCALSHYVCERASTMKSNIDYICYVRAKAEVPKATAVRDLVQQVVAKLVEAGKIEATDEKNSFELVCDCLKLEKTLIIFDHLEVLEGCDEAYEFSGLLSDLFRKTRHTRVLLTAKKPLGIPSLGGQVEHHYELGPLNLMSTVRLYSKLSPFLYTPKDQLEFFETLVMDVAEESLLPSNENLPEAISSIFDVMGAGIPSRIEKAAYTASEELFLELKSGKIRES